MSGLKTTALESDKIVSSRDLLLVDRNSEPIVEATVEVKAKDDEQSVKRYEISDSNAGIIYLGDTPSGEYEISLIHNGDINTQNIYIDSKKVDDQEQTLSYNNLPDDSGTLDQPIILIFENVDQSAYELPLLIILFILSVLLLATAILIRKRKKIKNLLSRNRAKAIVYKAVHQINIVIVIILLTLLVSIFAAERGQANTELSTLRNRARSFANTIAKPVEPSDIKSCSNANDMRDNYTLIHGMARSFSATSNDLLKKELRSKIASNLNWMRDNCYRKGYSKFNNWYINQVNIPFSITSTLLLVDGISNENILADDAYSWASTQYNTHQTANMTVVAKNMLSAAILLEDRAKIRDIFTGDLSIPSRLLDTRTTNGFLQDGSFDFHSVMHTDYGSVMLDDLARMLSIIRGTEFDLEGPVYDNLFSKVFSAFEGVMHNKQFMEFSRGRAMTVKYGDNQADWFFSSLKVLRASAPANHRSRIDAWLKQVGEINDSNINTRQPLNAMLPYNEQSKAVAHRGDYAVGLAMNSAWARAFEGQNSQNMQGWYLSEGRIELHSSKDPEQYNDYWWATIDRKRLPGTTSINKVLPNILCDPTANPNVKNAATTVLGNLGLSSFNQNVYVAEGARQQNDPEYTATCGIAKTPRVKAEIDLQSKKSYFFFDNEVVLIGSNIVSNDLINHTETTIENRKVTDMSKVQIVTDNTTLGQASGTVASNDNVSWMHVSGLDQYQSGYHFLNPTSIKTLKEERTGSWSDVTTMTADRTPNDPSRKVTRQYFTSWIDHGVAPKNANYGYVMLPSYDKQMTEKYNNSPDVKLITQNEKIHHVTDTSTGSQGIVFWEAGESIGYKADAPANIFLTSKDNLLSLSISSADLTPSANRKVKITTPLRTKSTLQTDNRITIVSTNPLIFIADLSADDDAESPRGKSWQASFELDDTNDQDNNDTDSNTDNGGDVTDNQTDNSGTPNGIPPTVKINSPADGTTIAGTINLEYTSSDDKEVEKIEIAFNGSIVATQSKQTSYSFNTKTLADGPLQVSIVAYDSAKNSSKETINLYVKNNITVKPKEPVLIKNNLAPNHSFETTPNDYFTVKGAGASLQWSSKESRSGSNSLEIYSSNSNGSMNDQRWLSNTTTIPASPGKYYSAEVWVKTAAVTGSVRSRINFWDANTSYINPTSTSSNVSGSNDWTKLTIPLVQAPSSAKYLRVEILQAGKGWTWIDDLRICENNCIGELDEVAPKVVLQKDMIRFTADNALSLEANATDNIGVVRIDYYANNLFVCSSDEKLKNCTWRLTNDYPNGDYEITAKAFDTTGNSSVSQLLNYKIRQPDINRDNKVNVIDLSRILANWGKTQDKQHDLNDNGKVDLQDLSIMLSKWRST